MSRRHQRVGGRAWAPWLTALCLLWPAGAGAQPSPVREATALDLDGRRIAPLDDPQAAAVVLLFTEVNCPVANRYAPEISRLNRAWSPKRVRFWLVYPDSSTGAGAVRDHMRDYGLAIDAVRDPEHALVRAAGATVTPEAAVFVKGVLRYVGRIDDRARDFGVFAAVAQERTLEEALRAVLAGGAVRDVRVPGVGCVIADLGPRARPQHAHGAVWKAKLAAS